MLDQDFGRATGEQEAEEDDSAHGDL